ncbi:MAG: sigma-70 family RNA polymerase sigma factor [Pseudomonadota bacterium]
MAQTIKRTVEDKQGPTLADVAKSAPSDRLTDETSRFDELESLYTEYVKPLSVALRTLYGDGPPDPEEVAQEAFHRVINHKDHSSIANLKAFIWRTARNLVFDEKKRAVVRRRYDFEVERLFFPFEGDGSTPETLITAREQLELINQALADMPEKRRRALILHRIEGLTLTEVGRRLGIGRTAVAKHVARAAADLNALFLD